MLAAQDVVQTRRRGRFDDLLVAQLHGAVPLVEVDGVPVGVGEDLDLDVPGATDHPLHEQGAVAEGGRRLAPAAFEGLRHGCRRRAPGECLGRRRRRRPSASPDSRAPGRQAAASSAERTVPGLPGTTGMPSDAANDRAWVLSPKRRSAAAPGPTKVSPAAAVASANAALSDRNP